MTPTTDANTGPTASQLAYLKSLTTRTDSRSHGR